MECGNSSSLPLLHSLKKLDRKGTAMEEPLGGSGITGFLACSFFAWKMLRASPDDWFPPIPENSVLVSAPLRELFLDLASPNQIRPHPML